MEAKEQENTVTILATQEVEEKTGLVLKDDVRPMANSIYYNEAKGWIFNDIIYMDGCATYGSSYGGTPVGMLTPGYYRFVKSNGSYVALCEVELVADCMARKAYAELWEKYGGMWSWEQAFYNQLDGTPELANPTDKKTAKLENGVTVIDITQNYRFIKCWIKIEDLRPNPETTVEEYAQTVRYFIRDKKSGKCTEQLDMKQESKVKKGDTVHFVPENKNGYRIESVMINGIETATNEVSYVVTGKNEVCIYYTPYRLKVVYFANDGSEGTKEQVCYYGESQKLYANPFSRDGALFLGWSTSEDNGEVIYGDEEVINFDLSHGDVNLKLYALWDLAPQVKLPDLYFTKKDLLSKDDIDAYVLSFCSITDWEDESIKQQKESVMIRTDLLQEIQMISEGWVEYQVEVTDSKGNTVEKGGRLYIVDATPVRLRDEEENMRFISLDYLPTLDGDSVWMTNSDYYKLLVTCLKKEKGAIWKKTPYGWKRVS